MNEKTIQKATAKKPSTAQSPTMQAYIKRMDGEIAKALPSVMTPDRFSRIVLSALSTNPELGHTTPTSFLAAMMTCAQLGLEPNTPLGQAYLIPYNNYKTNVKECQFQLGYKGLIDLAYRSGQVSIIQAQTVCENDEFEYELGLEPKLRHVPARTNRGKAILYYAMFKTKDGGFGFDVMSVEDVNEVRKRSKAKSGPWVTDFDAMAKKTVLKRCLKYAPLKTEFMREVARDETVSNEIDRDMTEVVAEYPADDPQTEPVQEVVDASTGELIGEPVT